MKFITVTSIGNLRNSYWNGVAWYEVGTQVEVRVADKHVVYCVSEQCDAVKRDA